MVPLPLISVRPRYVIWNPPVRSNRNLVASDKWIRQAAPGKFWSGITENMQIVAKSRLNEQVRQV